MSTNRLDLGYRTHRAFVWYSAFRFLCLAAGTYYVSLYFYIAFHNLLYPYPLEWLEADTLDFAGRILRGLPLYCEPSYAYIPTMKPPLYYYLVAAVMPLIGDGLVAGRLVSILSVAGVCCFVWGFIWREGGSRFWAWLGVGLFLATFKIAELWYDIARLDSLYLLVLIASFYVLRFWTGSAGAVAAGVLFAVSYFAKQTTLLMAVPVLLALSFMAWRRAAIVASVMGALVGTELLVLHWSSGGWTSFFLLEVPRHGTIDWPYIGWFWTGDLLRPLAPALLGSLALIVILAQQKDRRSQAIFYGSLLFAAVLTGYLGRIHNGGASNALMPIYAVLGIMAPLAACHALRDGSAAELPRRVFPVAIYLSVLAQFALLVYAPSDAMPSSSDKQAGDRVLSFLRTIDGDVLVMDDRFFPILAGKQTRGLGYAINDLLRDQDSPVAADLKKSIVDAVLAGKFAGVVDPPDFVFAAVKFGPAALIQPLPANADYNQFRPRPQYYYPVIGPNP